MRGVHGSWNARNVLLVRRLMLGQFRSVDYLRDAELVNRVTNLMLICRILLLPSMNCRRLADL